MHTERKKHTRTARYWRYLVFSYIFTLGAGGLLCAAFPPLNAWWAAPLGLAMLAFVVQRSNSLRSVCLGFVFGIGFFTPLLHFTAVSMGNNLGWICLTLFESLYLAIFALIYNLSCRIKFLPIKHIWIYRAIFFTCLFTGVEQIRSACPWGGFPFGRVAFAMADAPILNFAAYGGSTGVCLLVAGVGGLLAEGVVGLFTKKILRTAVAAVLIVFFMLFPLMLPVDSAAQAGSIDVGAVQGNVAQDATSAFARALEVTNNHTEATLDLAKHVGAGNLDFVIWPENAADRDPRTDANAAQLVTQAVTAVGAPILVGAVKYTNNIRYNDIVIWEPTSGSGQYYRKHRPVPFGEYIPWRNFIHHFTTQVDRIGTDMLPGTGGQTLTVHAAASDRDVVLAMGICFEVAYDDLLRQGVRQGGEVIVIPTNNANFLHSSEAAQQLAQGRVQAVIHGRSVVQVSTVGITAVISPQGVVEKQLTPYTQSWLTAKIPLRTTLTVADRLGSWPAYVVLFMSGICALTAILSVIYEYSSWRRRTHNS